MLLGRPWQRRNLVSIDECEEGTYLIFKDRETQLPRFELLAVPHDRSFEEDGWPASHYQMFFLNKQILSLENQRKVFVPNFRYQASCCRSASVEHDWRGSENEMSRWHSQEIEKQEDCEGKIWAMVYNGIGWWIQVFWKIVVATFWSAWRRMEELCNGENTPFGIFNADGEQPKSLPMSISAPAPQMSLSTIPVDPVLLNDGGGHFRSFEEIQYLSRQAFHAPPIPIAALNASGPIFTVEDFTARQWMKYIDCQPLDVDPTFAIALQSEYYGSIELPDGQILHRSTAANVLRIFRDRTTGRPYTIACHKFTFHLAAPNDPQKV
jgi:hypothetical protein